MRQIFLHIGRGKTGTTLLQSYLGQKQKELIRQDLHYIRGDGEKGLSGHQLFAKSFIDNPPEVMRTPKNLDKERERIADEIKKSNCQKILISSENLVIANIQDIKDFFNALHEEFEIKIIYFVRSQDEVAESEYNQLVKVKRETCSFTTYAHKKLEGCDYFSILSEWENHFGRENLIVKIFDARRNTIIPDFMSIFSGIDYSSLSYFDANKDKRANKSVGIQGISLIRNLNSLEIKDRRNLYAQIARSFEGNDLPAIFFNSEAARNFRLNFVESNRKFYERYLGVYRNDIGGRRYSDTERDEIFEKIKKLHGVSKY